jgi:hypothetical protein
VANARWRTGVLERRRQLSEDELKKLEQSYAHFHRVLGALAMELAALPGVIWVGKETTHVIAPEGENNRYGKAIYPVTDLAPYRDALRELLDVQQQGMRLTEREEPLPGMLLPQVVEGVQFARLNRHTAHTSQAFNKEQAIGRLQTVLKRAEHNLAKFERYATLNDPERERVALEVKTLKEGLEQIKGADEAEYRFRVRRQAVTPYVYLLDGDAAQTHIRDHGLVLVGPSVSVVWNQARRRPRSDKRKLEPLLHIGTLKVYRESEWQQAGQR